MRKKIVYENIKKYFKERGCKLLDKKYIGSFYKIKYIAQCGHINSVTIGHFKNGHGRKCPKCMGVAKHTYKEVKEYIEKHNYKLISNRYIGNKTKLKTMCPNRHIYYTRFNDFVSGYRCAECANKKKHTIDFVKKEFAKCRYNILENKYTNCKIKMKIMCNKRHKFLSSYNNFQQGRRCPICRLSKGEEVIRLFLEKNNIKFEKQKTFPKCKERAKLRFDFYLPKYNGLIEYQGIQHYEISNFFGGQRAFEGRKKRDKIKYNFAKQKNINLLIIQYTKFNNIEQTIVDFIKKIKKGVSDE